jgi:hypothetical protein
MLTYTTQPRITRHVSRIAGALLGIAIAVAGATSCKKDSDEGASDEPDCAYAEESWGQKTQQLGQECSAGSYGACDIVYDNCIQGTCSFIDVAPYSICSETCTSDADCNGLYCREGACSPGAECNTFCDEFCCCEYFQDPNDPTQCQQGSCSCG